MMLDDKQTERAAAPSTMEEEIPSWLPAGMDVKSSYLLKIKITTTTMRKEVSGFCVDKVLDSDTINHRDFVDDFGKQYPWSHNEMLKIYYVDDCTYHQVSSDQDMVQMFAKFSATKQIDIVMHIHGVDENPQLPPIPPKTSAEVPCTPSLPIPSQAALSQPSSSTQPSLHNYVAGENETNPFEENEHVGVDDEGMYSDSNANGEKADDESGYVPDSSDSDEDEGVNSQDEDWVANDAVPDNIPIVAYDEENPPMTVGTMYPNIEIFRMALSQYAIKGEFEYNIEKSEPGRIRVYCSNEDCDWRLYATVMDDNVTMKVKINTMEHNCETTRLNEDIKHATSKWVAEKVRSWLIEDATVRPKELQRRLRDKYKILVSSKKVYYGKEIAMRTLYGGWEESFDKLYNLKAEIDRSCPGSVFVIDHHEIAGVIRFKRLFIALKPCVDGFLQGCRPYLAIDSTFLTGKFKGQLATACAVDGHNWMYPVAFGVIDSETSDNWLWFMERLKDAIGTPEGLTICNDAGKGIDGAVQDVFPTAEHRECMMHLVTNFKKRFHGKVFDDHLWPAAYSWNPYHYNKHMGAIQQAKAEAIEYLRKNHIRLWSRSQFSTYSKVDYVTNNLAESFNNWVKQYKGLNLADFFDKIYHKLMVKWELRRRVSKKMQGHILPHIVKELKGKSRGLDLTVDRSDEHIAEVNCLGTSGFRHVVNLKDKTCTCCEWQLSTMMYPPSMNQISTSSTRSVTGSNEVPLLLEAGATKKGNTRSKVTKAKGCKRKAKSVALGHETPSATKRKSSIVAPASPAMNTRSKANTTSSPAMGTRSKVAANNPALGTKRKL